VSGSGVSSRLAADSLGVNDDLLNSLLADLGLS
jgi:hypothetical protein